MTRKCRYGSNLVVGQDDCIVRKAEGGIRTVAVSLETIGVMPDAANWPSNRLEVQEKIDPFLGRLLLFCAKKPHANEPPVSYTSRTS
jgi:hypothetical protein